MISLLPAFHETLVLAKPAGEVFAIIAGATSLKPFIQQDEERLIFNGWVKENKFRISKRERRVNYYLPIVIGQLEATSSGSLLFIDYRLFPSTRMLMTLWTILIILGSVVFWFQVRNNWIPAGGLVLLLVIYTIVWSNFRIHLKPTLSAIHNLLA